MHSTANLPLLAILEKLKFSSEKLIYFFKKTQNSNVLRNLTISVAFNGKCATTVVKSMRKRERNWQNRVFKKFALSGRLCSNIINNMAQNNETSVLNLAMTV